MKTRIFAGLISSILLTCLWMEQSAVATAAGSGTESAAPVAANKADTRQTSVLHVMSSTNSPGTEDEVPVLLLNLRLDN